MLLQYYLQSHKHILTSLFLSLCLTTLPTYALGENMIPPKAEKIPQTMTLHNDTRIDNYFWLRDDNRQDSKIIDYLNAENKYTQHILSAGKELQKSLFDEMVARISQEDQSAPYDYNGYTYRTIYTKDKEFPVYQRKRINSDDEWEVLVDGNERSKGHAFYKLGGYSISEDNQRIAIVEDLQGRRQYQVSYKNIDSEHWTNAVIKNTSGNIVWAADNNSLLYVRKHSQTLLPYQVYIHSYNSDTVNDHKIFQEDDDRFYVSLSCSRSKEYIFITSSSSTTSEERLIDAKSPTSEIKIFSPRKEAVEYDLEHFEGVFYIRSNHESELFGLYKAKEIDNTWETLIEPQDSVDLEDFILFNNWMVIQEREQGLPTIRIINTKTQQQRQIKFDDPAYMAWLSFNPQSDTNLLRYGYTSMTTPSTVYELNMDSDERNLIKQQDVKGFDSSKYESQRIWIKARDGIDIPVSIVYRNDLYKKGENPILIYGYGAYGASMDPAFSSTRLSLLDRGFVYALVHIRGGGELGKKWYNAGKLENKINSFNDFIDATKSLLSQQYASPQHVYAMGGSAGGLLMGAVINQAPELYNGVVAQVPFVDVINTMLDPTIPLTTGEYDEWGNPEKEEAYWRIKAYSPYDNVTAQSYPNLLVTTGLHDSQVQYWEPAKWVAKLRELKTDNNIILLQTDMNAGHGGKSGRFNSLNDIALEYSFILMLEKPDKYFNTEK